MHENKVLHRIVDTNARSKSMSGISKEKCDMILAIASLDRPIKQEIWDKVKTNPQQGGRNILGLTQDGYVMKAGTKKLHNSKEFTTYKLTELGEYTAIRLLGLERATA